MCQQTLRASAGIGPGHLPRIKAHRRVTPDRAEAAASRRSESVAMRHGKRGCVSRARA